MQKRIVFATAIAFADPGIALAQDEPARKGYEPPGELITNPAKPGLDLNVIVCRKEERTRSRAKRGEVGLPIIAGSG